MHALDAYMVAVGGCTVALGTSDGVGTKAEAVTPPSKPAEVRVRGLTSPLGTRQHTHQLPTESSTKRHRRGRPFPEQKVIPCRCLQ